MTLHSVGQRPETYNTNHIRVPKKDHVLKRLSQNQDLNSIQHPWSVYTNCKSQTVSFQFEPELFCQKELVQKNKKIKVSRLYSIPHQNKWKM